MPISGEANSLYIGLMSGTSMDGIDAALVRLGDNHCETVATTSYAYPAKLREALLSASRNPSKTTVDDIGDLDHWVGSCFRDAAIALLSSSGTDRSLVAAIGSHGQTIRHMPRAERPFTLQIGDPNIIASGTGITTVADFRRRDLAVGGEGAPLAPAFHRWLFADISRHRVVLNIGGIANITVLPPGSENIVGFDTGPGNGLMDAWIQQIKEVPFDHNGDWGRDGNVQPEFLSSMLGDAYFDLPPPKSTGFEYFNLEWVSRHIGPSELAAIDVQASLLALTAGSIGDVIKKHAPDTQEILVCGGGVHNAALMSMLAADLAPVDVRSTGEFGLDPDWVEAAAFGWLAKQTMNARPGNLPSVTGAQHAVVLGGIYVCTN
jgi:anhydro-N-acetylmuramic acid kinase